MEEHPETIQNFVNALQKGMDYVQSHTPEEIAKAIEPQFPESDLETITTIVTRYYDQDTWKENLIFEKSSFELLQDILESAGELEIPRKGDVCPRQSFYISSIIFPYPGFTKYYRFVNNPFKNVSHFFHNSKI